MLPREIVGRRPPPRKKGEVEGKLHNSVKKGLRREGKLEVETVLNVAEGQVGRQNATEKKPFSSTNIFFPRPLLLDSYLEVRGPPENKLSLLAPNLGDPLEGEKKTSFGGARGAYPPTHG